MKIVNRQQYLAFIAKLDSGIEEMARDPEVTGVIQSVAPDGEVRAQVLYSRHGSPQYMIGVRQKYVVEPNSDPTRHPRSLEDAALAEAAARHGLG